VVDRLFSNADLAALYDAFCEGRPDFAFYLPLVMGSNSVLEVVEQFGYWDGQPLTKSSEEIITIARQRG